MKYQVLFSLKKQSSEKNLVCSSRDWRLKAYDLLQLLFFIVCILPCMLNTHKIAAKVDVFKT